MLLVVLSSSIAAALFVAICCRNCCAPALGLALLLLLAAAPALAALRGEFESHPACCSVLNLGPLLGWFEALSGSKVKANTRVFTASAAGTWLTCPDASMWAGYAMRSTGDLRRLPTSAHARSTATPGTPAGRQFTVDCSSKVQQHHICSTCPPPPDTEAFNTLCLAATGSSQHTVL
jgi:hypothetical protein